MKENFAIVSIICIISIVIISGRRYNINLQDSNLNEQLLNIEEVPKEEKIKYKVSTYITSKMKEEAKLCVPIICWAYGFDPEYLFSECDNIAIIRIMCIDKMTMKPKSYGSTYGKALINNTIRGNLKEGDIITFSKNGGIIDLESLENETNQKYEIPTGKENIPKNEVYFNVILEDDYNIEEGKTYLAYLKYDQTTHSYMIIGQGYGLRELEIKKEDYISKIDIDFNNTKLIKNENVHEYSNIEFTYLQEYIDKYIKTN